MDAACGSCWKGKEHVEVRLHCAPRGEQWGGQASTSLAYCPKNTHPKQHPPNRGGRPWLQGMGERACGKEEGRQLALGTWSVSTHGACTPHSPPAMPMLWLV